MVMTDKQAVLAGLVWPRCDDGCGRVVEFVAFDAPGGPISVCAWHRDMAPGATFVRVGVPERGKE
jgi:hypothetical protein